MTGRVMHKRMFPKINAFHYGIYYLALPLDRLNDMPIARNRFAPMSFFDEDHGAKDGSDLQDWATHILAENGLLDFDGTITLLAMPRIFGYVFNPISYWLCHDRNGQLIAYLCEVNNTFGETHTYICAHEDYKPIDERDVLKARKVFHVSPFIKREGHYDFRLEFRNNNFGSWIDYYNADDKKQLITALTGNFIPMTHKTARSLFWSHPLVTIKAITMIHWQAARLLVKRISYISKPKQAISRISTTKDNKKTNAQ